ncbi:hypothetical protein ACFCXS_30200 [Streptomyces sp. NPDC056373]|uniref:hypothetical protein n=1 Tax=Streptomyces sp. NPDC056373 TaxID=3345798 RepID=UPI0035DFD28F
MGFDQLPLRSLPQGHRLLVAAPDAPVPRHRRSPGGVVDALVARRVHGTTEDDGTLLATRLRPT